jgi:PIN domain
LRPSIILIDFENVQPKDLARLRGQSFTTKVFCGVHQTKVPFDLAAELQPLGKDAEYIRIQGTGRNALDFHIAFYIGRLSAEMPDATFFIISRDAGFDPLIKHLQTRNIPCQRLSSLSEVPGASQDPATPPVDRLQRIADGLLSRKQARPRTRKTLAAYIRGQLNTHASDAAVNQVISRLTEAGLCVLADGRVTYPPLSGEHSEGKRRIA